MSHKQPAATQLTTPGSRIRLLRRTLDMKQRELAAKVHATQAAVSQWENDETLPTRTTQHLIADALNASWHFLFGEVEEGVVA